MPNHATVPMMSATVPMMASDMPGGPTAVYNKLLDSRIVILGTDVNDEIANLLSAQLLYLQAEDPNKDIWMYINSPGGSVTAGMAIYDTMQFVTCDVATVCMGMAASMGQFLLCAGAPGKRFALPHSEIMMHQPLGGIRGQASDIKIQAEHMQRTKRTLFELISHHSGQPYEKLVEDADRDRWFTPEQAREYGLIDKVITKQSQMIS